MGDVAWTAVRLITSEATSPVGQQLAQKKEAPTKAYRGFGHPDHDPAIKPSAPAQLGCLAPASESGYNADEGGTTPTPPKGAFQKI
jgi:hypothetical protein